MPDNEAVVVFKLVDASGAGTPSASTPQQQSSQVPGSSLAADSQAAITAAGGAGNLAAKSNTSQPAGAAPVIPAAGSPVQPAVGDPLASTIRGITAADPNATAAEVAKLLGITTNRATQLMGAATAPQGNPPAGLPPASPSAPAVPLPTVPAAAAAASPVAVPPIAPATLTPPPSPAVPQPPAVPPPVAGTAPPLPPPTAPPIFGQPPAAPPVVNPPMPQPGGPSAAQGVQTAVSAIARVAAQGGPLAGAFGGVAQTAVAQFPALAATAGPIAAAAPYLAVGAAAVAIPAAAAYTINRMADTAIGQAGSYSGELTAAQATANVRQIMADMRTAGRLGNELADLTTARSRLSANTQGIRDVVFEPIAQKLADVVNGLAKVTAFINDRAQENPAIVQAGSSVAWEQFLNTLPVWVRVLEHMGRKADKADEDDGGFNYWMKKELPELPPPFTGRDQVPFETQFRNATPGLGI